VPAHQHSVLIVEDDADNREAIETLVESAGYNALGVPHGRQALAALRGGFRPCLILLDIAMPEMDGFAFRREQLADPDLAAIPVIVVSAGGYVNEAQARQLGMTTIFRKPMDIDRFTAALHSSCGRLS
jgi:CheY-like chemotaxis protein